MATIHFKTVFYKNFLSTGNAENKIILDKSRTTLITGQNGNGKSTIMDAITFGLFGKPFRDIKLGQLINSINSKHCLVTVEFDIGSKQYKVIRGLKPAIFEIYEDNILLNQDAASRDYQKVLEQQILRLNYKTFTQVVILGSASFVPFMQLKTSQRREVVEDILDIKIFSVMNSLLKDRMSVTKDSITRLENDISNVKTKVQSQTAIIKTMASAKTDTIQALQNKIESNNNSIDIARNKADELNIKISKLTEEIKQKSKYESELKSINETISGYNASMKHSRDHIKFFIENNNCPTCSQEITEEYRDKVIDELQSKVYEDNDEIEKLKIIINQLNDSISEMLLVSDKITQTNIDMSVANNAISLLKKQNKELEIEIESVNNDTSNIDEEKRVLKELAADAMAKITAKTSYMQERELQEVSSLLLKDSGIKTAIIREYLPVMNTLINKYLAIMDTYVKFELDESFNETIKSRHRDDFTYYSFSEGEKKRIDIAILFAWRQIARMKNSVNTNLLILDEVLDSSLDTTATESLMNLINELSKNSNIFVVSHKTDTLDNKFNSVLKIEKINDFSVIV